MSSHPDQAYGRLVVKGTGNRERAMALTLGAMSLGFGVVQLDVTIVNTALDSIGKTIGGDVSSLQWVVSSYTITFAAMILTAGTLGDRFGAKPVFMAGFAIFTIASFACALAPTDGLLITARAVQGIGAALLVPNSLALLNHAYQDEAARARAVAVWAAGASFALAMGPLAGGALMAIGSWRWIFLVNLPIGAAGFWLTLRYAQDTARSAPRQLDLTGQCLCIAALGILAAALIEGGALGWSHPLVLGGVAGALVCAMAFILRERYASQPMLPLTMFSRAVFTLSAMVGLLANTGFYGLTFVLSLYFQRAQGLSPLSTGLAFLPMMAAILPANLLAPLLADRIGASTTIVLGAGLSAIGAVGLVIVDKQTSYSGIALQLAALGVGLGLIVPPLTATLMGSVDKSRSGIAAGVLNATRQTGSLIGVALFGSLISGSNDFIMGLRASLMISTFVFVLSAGIFLWRRFTEAKAV